MKIASIHKKLVRSLSISITSVTVVILLLTDVAVDLWVHDEFNRAMESKAKLLTSLVHESEQGVEFDFAGEFMPEFSSDNHPEYFQLWRNNQVLERSDTLGLFAKKTFAYKDLKIGESLLEDITLPDGRDGQVYYYRFIPQVDSVIRQAFKRYLQETGRSQEPILIAYATSAEKLSFVTWLIDISFLVSALSVAIIVRTLVTRAVNRGLAPLDEFVQSLKSISLADKASEVGLINKVEELIPIQESINEFIRENRKLYLKEQQLTSDIAHELKTPISELINLAEVAIRFPQDQKINRNFKPDMLEISQRLQNIVSNILLFNKYSHNQFEKNDVFDVVQTLNRLTTEINRQVHIKKVGKIEPISSNLFAFETIFSNLLHNAAKYSPPNTTVFINITNTKETSLSISITNKVLTHLEHDDLLRMFDPLWQKDTARTSNENFGLGLSIVKTFCDALGGNVKVTTVDSSICFTVNLINDAISNQIQ